MKSNIIKVLSNGKMILSVEDLSIFISNVWSHCNVISTICKVDGRYVLGCNLCHTIFEIRQMYGPYNCWNCKSPNSIDETCEPSEFFPKYGYKCKHCGKDLQGWFGKGIRNINTFNYNSFSEVEEIHI